MHPVNPSAISATVVKYVQENMGVNQASVTLFDTAQNTIKIHLLALGLIHSEASESKGGGILEYVSLTPKGRQKLLELLAVRPTAPVIPV
jgi:hypothetical protein